MPRDAPLTRSRTSAGVAIIHQLAAQPRVYNIIQRIAGVATIRPHLRRRLVETAGTTVLDIGAGTGLYLSCFPESAWYIWLDKDPQKLQGFHPALPVRWSAVIGDAARLGFAHRSIDYAVCTNMMHHLDDVQLRQLIDELARVVRRKVILHDAVKTTRWSSRALWMLDRGTHPRSAESLIAAVKERFDIEHVERYSVFHEYVLVVAMPIRHAGRSR